MVDHRRRLLPGVAAAFADQEFRPDDSDATAGPLFDPVNDAAVALGGAAASVALWAGDPPAVLEDLTTLLRTRNEALRR